MLGLHSGSVVSADMLLELLWGDDPPRTAAKALQTHISSLRRALGDGFVLTEGTGWILNPPETDASRYKQLTRRGRDAASAGDTAQAVARFEEALSLWRGTPELPDSRRGIAEKTRWIESHAALVEDRADALLATGRAAEIVGELEAAVADAPLRERRWGQLMLALYRAGRQGEALAAFRRARSLLADELGVDPGTELRRLEAAIVAQDAALDAPVLQHVSSVMRAVTFLLTDIEGSTAAWEADSDAMAVALARHDELVEQIVTSRGGRLIKTRGEGDATFSVFDRPSGAAAAALELQDAVLHEPWALRAPLRVRVALHTGEAELRDGDYFGRAVNRAARLRSLAEGAQILCSGATAELVIDSLPDDVVLADLGMRHLKNLARPEHVFELRADATDAVPQTETVDDAIERPPLPTVLTGPGPFVGRVQELERLLSAWQSALSGGTRAVLIAGEPGVGKTRLGGEWSQQAYQQGAVVLYGRCDEDLGAPYQPFAEALRSLVRCIGARRLRALRGVEALLSLVPALTEVLPDLAAPTRADPDTERYALFDAVVAVLEAASASAPVVLILDDLHWAAKPTLLLLRHLLRFGDHARVQVVGTYRSTDLDRSHPLAAMLADLHRDGTAERINLSGLDGRDVTAYVAESGHDDEDLANALASVTGGNPFFLIEALRHVEESGGIWDQSTLPQGVREAVSRRLSRLPAETNKALAAAAVVGSRFAVELVEQVVEDDLIDAFDEACKAGIIIEEPGGRYRFNHAIVRQSLLAELASVRRMRLHQRIATTLEAQSGSEDELLAELAHHYFECAWAGNAGKAVEYCRRAADQAMARLAYEGAAELYDRALHAMEELDDELPDRDDLTADLLVARCEALLAAGDVTSAAGAVSQLRTATVDSVRLAAWATCFDGQLSMLIHPERLDEVEPALGAAAERLAGLDDAAGEATAHTVRAGCLARLGRIGDCEVALDEALTAARRAREHRRVNAVLAGAPLAALWGPNPVPRAGGRCLDVVRLLRITTDSPAVEATSTRCQAVLEAFRGRAAAARRMIDSARRTVTELGLRHALMEVEQFAGIVELVSDEPAAAEPHLRKAYKGFRRMGLDADTAETAALLGRACLALERVDEADELCLESERLAGHALKPSIAWRVLRAHLLSRSESHGEARLVAEAAVALAERTDALVDHGDACLSLAMVLGAAGDAARARAVAEQAADLYERKGAVALAEKARGVLGEQVRPIVPTSQQAPAVEFHTAAAQVGERVMAAVASEAWGEFDRLFAPDISIESRRKVIGFKKTDVPSNEIMRQTWGDLRAGTIRVSHVVIAVRGEHLALAHITLGTADSSPGAPRDEFLQLYGVDDDGRVNLQIWFDLDDMDAATAELDQIHAQLQDAHRLEQRFDDTLTTAAQNFSTFFAAQDWVAMAGLFADDPIVDDRRRTVNTGVRHGKDAVIKDLQMSAAVGFTDMKSVVVATRGKRLSLNRFALYGQHAQELVFEVLHVVEHDTDARCIAVVIFDLEDFDAAVAELDARYLNGEAAAHAHAWSMLAESYASLRRQEFPAVSPDSVFVDHRRAAAFGSADLTKVIQAGWDLGQHIRPYIETVHHLSDLGGVCTFAAQGVSDQGFAAEWRGISLAIAKGDMLVHCEFYDEADLEAAIARFDELGRPESQLENATTRIYERMWKCFEDRDWATITGLIADDELIDDRRRVVNGGVRHGRNAGIEELRAAADVGFTISMLNVKATRGDRLALALVRASGRNPGAIQNNVLQVVCIDADERIAGVITFDLEDVDAAYAELDARYATGEAAAYAHTWSVITNVFIAHNRREIAAMTTDAVSIDHRRVAAFAPDEGLDYILAGWDLDQNLSLYIEQVHRANDTGAVFTWTGTGTSHQGFRAEWRGVELMTVQGDLLSRAEVFDEFDVDAALARFEQLCPPKPQLQKAATQTAERLRACFAARNWEGLADVLAEDIVADDRRRVVGLGIRRGREVNVADIRVGADIGTEDIISTVIATRGDRLSLDRARYCASDRQLDALSMELLRIVEVDTDNRMTCCLMLDGDDFDAAIAELDARYLAGEAAAHSHTWSVISGIYAAFNCHEVSATDWVTIDHRRGTPFVSNTMLASIRAVWDLTPDLNISIEAVHQLNDFGAVITHTQHGTSSDGFDAEWRQVQLLTVDGDRIDRCEIFDEDDLDAALARFSELQPPTRRLENAASRASDCFFAESRARNWHELTELLAHNSFVDDRRHVVNIGVWDGRDSVVANFRTLTEALSDVTSAVVAIRGERLALCRICAPNSDLPGDDFAVEMLGIAELDADNRIAAHVLFDPDDFGAATRELDARYLAGEGAAHCQTWSVIVRAFASLNERELPATTPELVRIDNRQLATFGPGDWAAFLHTTWGLTPDITTYIESVHRLNHLGAVVTHASHGTSQEGFDAEWRIIDIFTVDGNLISRAELFDEADLDAALARFDELIRPAPLLENAATRTWARLAEASNRRNLEGYLALSNPSLRYEDRRRGLRDEFEGLTAQRNAVLAMFEAVPHSVQMTSEPVAVRGSRLSLMHVRYRDTDYAEQPVTVEMMQIVEVDTDGLLVYSVSFDPEHIDAALDELDARYVAGEAADNAHTWSVIVRTYAAYRRGELPASDWINVDHRRGTPFANSDLTAIMRGWRELTPDAKISIEAVHRLNDSGAVVTNRSSGSSPDGFGAEWRMIQLLTVDGDRIDRCEMFDEADLETALTRFDEIC
jgi:class 3 adenylate cyclase